MRRARDMVARIEARLAAELAATPPDHLWLADFRAARVPPAPEPVQVSGGIMRECWRVTRSNGRYAVVFLPWADRFALVVEGQFSLLDIGVHGQALDCFASV